MGYMTELNTLLRVPKDFETTQLAIGKTFTVLTLFSKEQQALYK